MRIFDGSVNDGDGLKNGSVVDPGGVLIAGDPNVPPGSTSGCSISSSMVELKDRSDWLVVFAFLTLLAVQRCRRKGI